MDTQKQQIVERLKQANNILVTVKSNPSVDHLAACIGLTLALNKMGKHATAVFSGAIPSTIEFLQPEKTLEKNTDSLRDFIIALDKSKADKLRYKVEDKVVKIFITPYKTSISDKDLNFSQGDFNVDVVLAIGVHQQADLDQAITAHGRILHDAVVASVNVEQGPNLGGINWTKSTASSLSELATELIDNLDKSLLDGQIATAVLTGIVAETDRFSNSKTSPQTMSISAELMAVGANQQLVATKLAEPPAPPPTPAKPIANQDNEPPAAKKSDDGTLEIEHDDDKAPQIKIDENGSLHTMAQQAEKNDSDKKPVIQPAEATPPLPPEPPKEEKKQSEAEAAGLPELPEIPKITPAHSEAPHMITQPPTLGAPLTAATASEFFDPLVDSASGAPTQQPILDREPLGAPSDTVVAPPSTTAPTALDATGVPGVTDNAAAKADDALSATSTPPLSSLPMPVTTPATNSPSSMDDTTLSDIEKQLHSSHVTDDATQSASTQNDATPTPDDASTPPKPDVSTARDAVVQAVNEAPMQGPLPPIQALNAQPVGLDLRADVTPSAPDASTPTAASPVPSVSPAIIPDNSAPFAPEGLTLPGVTGVTDSATATPPPAMPSSETPDDPNAPPPVPPPMLPPLQN